jgi:hypothetical protein
LWQKFPRNVSSICRYLLEFYCPGPTRQLLWYSYGLDNRCYLLVRGQGLYVSRTSKQNGNLGGSVYEQTWSEVDLSAALSQSSLQGHVQFDLQKQKGNFVSLKKAILRYAAASFRNYHCYSGLGDELFIGDIL